MHPALRRHPIPGSGPRRHDTRHHLIAPRACRETSLPASQHYCPGASQGACDALDHAKIAPSTADAATNFLPRSPIRHRLPRPAQPLRKTPPRQIPIVGRPPTRPPAGSFLGGFRTPAAAPGRSVTTGRHPKPYTTADPQPSPWEWVFMPPKETLPAIVERRCWRVSPIAARSGEGFLTDPSAAKIDGNSQDRGVTPAGSRRGLRGR